MPFKLQRRACSTAAPGVSHVAMTEKLKIGIVGTGGMGKIHAAAYMKNEQAAVRGVCSVTRDLAQDFANGNWGTVALPHPRRLRRLEGAGGWHFPAHQRRGGQHGAVGNQGVRPAVPDLGFPPDGRQMGDL